MKAWLPPGWYLARVYADVESGATDLDSRSQTDSHTVLTDAGLRRDGGMADLLAEAMSPDPCFSVVVVEEIERASRDFYDSVTLERRLEQQGIPLLAADEPADISGLSPTMVLVRRIKQGVAEWYRISLKDKTRKGLEQHAIGGWNNGKAPYGYLPDRVPHAVPAKAAAGMTRTRLTTDPETGRGSPRCSTGGSWKTCRPGRSRCAWKPPAHRRRTARLVRLHRHRDPGQPQVHRPHGLRPH
jgi:hypothetical protein